MSVNEKMTAIADAIRGKTGKEDALTLDQMATEIDGIETDPVSAEALEKLDFYERYLRAQYGYSFEDWNPYVNDEGKRVITVNTRGIEYTIEEPTKANQYQSISIYPEFNTYDLCNDWIPNLSFLGSNQFMEFGKPNDNPCVVDLSRVTNYNNKRNKISPIGYDCENPYGTTKFVGLPEYCYRPILQCKGENAYSLGISFGKMVQNMSSNSVVYDNTSFGDKPVYVMEGFEGNLYLAKLNISAEHMLGIINNLADMSATTTKYTLNFGSHNLEKLTDEQIGIAEAKGWTVS